MTMTKEKRKQYMEEWYTQRKKIDPEYIKKINIRRKRRRARIIYNYLKDHPCVDCGEDDVRVLEADHPDSSKKEASVSDLFRRGSEEGIRRELIKCEIRCANCHRRRHFEERSKWIKELIEEENSSD